MIWMNDQPMFDVISGMFGLISGMFGLNRSSIEPGIRYSCYPLVVVFNILSWYRFHCRGMTKHLHQDHQDHQDHQGLINGFNMLYFFPNSQVVFLKLPTRLSSSWLAWDDVSQAHGEKGAVTMAGSLGKRLHHLALVEQLPPGLGDVHDVYRICTWYVSDIYMICRWYVIWYVSDIATFKNRSVMIRWKPGNMRLPYQLPSWKHPL